MPRYIVSFTTAGQGEPDEARDIEAEDQDEALMTGMDKLGQPLVNKDEGDVTIRIMCEDE